MLNELTTNPLLHLNPLAGVGLYNVKYSLLFALMLISSIMEVIGYAYVLPAAKCDLDMTDSQRGVVASLPYFRKYTLVVTYRQSAIVKLILPTDR